MENRNGLIVDGRVERGQRHRRARRGRRRCWPAMPGRHRITVGGDKGYDTAGFVAALRELNAHAARRPEHQQPPLGDRRPDHAPSRLRGQPAHPQADRGGVRLDQGDRPAAACPASRQGAGRLAVHAGGRRLQPDPAAQAAGGVMAKATSSISPAPEATRRRASNRTSRPPRTVAASGPRRHPPLFPQPASSWNSREPNPTGYWATVTCLAAVSKVRLSRPGRTVLGGERESSIHNTLLNGFNVCPFGRAHRSLRTTHNICWSYTIAGGRDDGWACLRGAAASLRSGGHRQVSRWSGSARPPRPHGRQVDYTTQRLPASAAPRPARLGP